MSIINKSKIRSVIWDFDGVFYDYHQLDPHIIKRSFDTCAAEAATKLLPKIDPTRAFNIASVGYKTHGGSYLGFEDIAVEHGYDREDFRRKIFEEFHIHTLKSFAQDYPHIMQSDTDLIQAFEKSAHLRHGVATHSCRDRWLIPIMTEKKILPYFRPAALIGRLQVDMADKALEATAIISAMHALQTTPKENVFVEDTLRNLERARLDIGPDLTTAYVHYGRPLPDLPPYVDAQFETPAHLLRHLSVI